MEKLEKLLEVCKLKIQFYDELIDSCERHLELAKKSRQHGMAITTNESLLKKYINSQYEWQIMQHLIENDRYLDERLEFLKSIAD